MPSLTIPTLLITDGNGNESVAMTRAELRRDYLTPSGLANLDQWLEAGATGALNLGDVGVPLLIRPINGFQEWAMALMLNEGVFYYPDLSTGPGERQDHYLGELAGAGFANCDVEGYFLTPAGKTVALAAQVAADARYNARERARVAGGE